MAISKSQLNHTQQSAVRSLSKNQPGPSNATSTSTSYSGRPVVRKTPNGRRVEIVNSSPASLTPHSLVTRERFGHMPLHVREVLRQGTTAPVARFTISDPISSRQKKLLPKVSQRWDERVHAYQEALMTANDAAILSVNRIQSRDPGFTTSGPGGKKFEIAFEPDRETADKEYFDPVRLLKFSCKDAKKDEWQLLNKHDAPQGVPYVLPRKRIQWASSKLDRLRTVHDPFFTEVTQVSEASAITESLLSGVRRGPGAYVVAGEKIPFTLKETTMKTKVPVASSSALAASGSAQDNKKQTTEPPPNRTSDDAKAAVAAHASGTLGGPAPNSPSLLSLLDSDDDYIATSNALPRSNQEKKKAEALAGTQKNISAFPTRAQKRRRDKESDGTSTEHSVWDEGQNKRPRIEAKSASSPTRKPVAPFSSLPSISSPGLSLSRTPSAHEIPEGPATDNENSDGLEKNLATKVTSSLLVNPDTVQHGSFLVHEIAGPNKFTTSATLLSANDSPIAIPLPEDTPAAAMNDHTSAPRVPDNTPVQFLPRKPAPGDRPKGGASFEIGFEVEDKDLDQPGPSSFSGYPKKIMLVQRAPGVSDVAKWTYPIDTIAYYPTPAMVSNVNQRKKIITTMETWSDHKLESRQWHREAAHSMLFNPALMCGEMHSKVLGKFPHLPAWDEESDQAEAEESSNLSSE